MNSRPPAAFISASWAALAAGMLAYAIGLYNANRAITVQKNTRDIEMPTQGRPPIRRQEGE